jgi:mannose-6-phosphate isomerase
MSELKPFKLTAVCKDYIWGGTRLITEYNQKTASDKAAESWELSCHPDGPSVVDGGAYGGLTLPGYINKTGITALGSDCAKFPYFPVLIKLIDAKNSLSIQVHPDNAYAKTHGGGFGKTEMWYIIDCKPGAFLYYGFTHKISKGEFKERIENGTLLEVLNKAYVHKGDVFFIDSGTLHAIGEGILLAEIQQNSNITYRIYDYGRLGKDGKPRELHIANAVDVTRLAPPERQSSPQGPAETFPGYSRTLLASCEYFTVYDMKINEAEMNAGENSFNSIICINGKGSLHGAGAEAIEFEKGGSVFVPASFGPYTISGNCEIIFTYV